MSVKGSNLTMSHIENVKDRLTPLLNQNGSSTSQVTSSASQTPTVPPTNSVKKHKTKMHSRSNSHVKLSTSSGPNKSGSRPHLNRSKSTDVLIRTKSATGLKRNNRSFTKLSGLQPLTKTVSNPTVIRSNKSTGSLKNMGGPSTTTSTTSHVSGLKTSGKKERAILRLNDDDNDDYEDVAEDETIDPVPEKFNLHSNSSTSINDSDNSNVEHKNSHIQDSNDNSRDLKSGTNNNNNNLNLVNSTRSSAENLVNPDNLYGGSLLLSQSTGLTKKMDAKSSSMLLNQRLKSGDAFITNNKLDSSVESESISGISFNANRHDGEQNIAMPVTTNSNAVQNNSYQPNQTIFNNLKRTNNQYLNTKKQPDQLPLHHQPQQQSQLPQQNVSVNNGANNFSNFLAQNQSSSSSAESNAQQIETRTQQRLWLQRENSLMDVTNLDPAKLSNFSNLSLNNLMFAHNYNQSQINTRDLMSSMNPTTPGATGGQPNQNILSNSLPTPPINGSVEGSSANINGLLTMVQNNHQNSIQSRTEFERLNREYLNVRRNSNPVGESLSRLENLLQGEKGTLKVTKTRQNNNASPSTFSGSNQNNSNTFKEFSLSFQEQDREANARLNRIWQEAIMSSTHSSSGYRSVSGSGAGGQYPSQTQRPPNNQRLTGNPSQQPTTRAVKLASQSTGSLPKPQIKRPEQQQQQSQHSSQQSLNVA